jgi:hypothetical protein
VAVTTHGQTFFDAANGCRIVTNTAPDGTYTVTTNQNGRVISTRTVNPLLGVLNSTTYGYDAHGRQNSITDARNGTTTNWFNAADQVSSVKTPAPAVGQSAHERVSPAQSHISPVAHHPYTDGGAAHSTGWFVSQTLSVGRLSPRRPNRHFVV